MGGKAQAEDANMAETRLERFLRSVGYPDRASDGSQPFTMRVDGMEIVAEESDGRIVLSFALTGDPAAVPRLASYAVGRMLREDAVLAYGATGPQAAKKPQAFLWQDAPADAAEYALVRLFESFADACDWWRARLDERGNVNGGEISEAVIRP